MYVQKNLKKIKWIQKFIFGKFISVHLANWVIV